MAEPITPEIKHLLQEAARKLTGPRKRAFMAETTIKLCQGSPRLAETMFGWSRAAVELGMHELRSGITCLDNYQARGNHRTEIKHPDLETAIHELVAEHSQADPRLKTLFGYTRIGAESVRRALIEHKGYADEDLPTVRTVQAILNRLGYRLQSVQKTKPQKKIPETDAIFANVAEVNRTADATPTTLRISIDTKATVAVGDYSRDGQSRAPEPIRALDHDMQPKTKLVPFGLLNLETDDLYLAFGTSHKTSDFLVDCLHDWWHRVKATVPAVTELVVNSDNGPESAGRRTQFLARLVDFAQSTGLRVRLIYYPPYHSKYNPIERCWAALEHHWNGTLLSNIDITLKWAKTMTWKGLNPVVALSQKVYAKGVSLTKAAMATFDRFIHRSPELPLWDVLIDPHGMEHGV
jgi:Rhodopirellula transposase DDE domain